MLKFFELEARFPRHGGEVPQAAVVYVADQVGVDPGEFASYDLTGRSATYHRAQVRGCFGFREATRSDEPAHAGRLTADRRALSPLYWSHVNPYGTFRLDMERRLDLDRGPEDPDGHDPMR